MHKAGFVNIVGNPNVGKSTLMNLLVGERISIATFKAQTTRHRIMGIVNDAECQIVFSDTPGVLKPNYKMQEMMLAFSESALSDADVLLHAITDAILGAAALGDIGKHFPDTDPAYHNADSMKLLAEVVRLIEEKGYEIGNVDATVIAQRPKLLNYIPTMKENISKTLKVDPDQVNVKATTEEHLGFTGEGLGISAQAVCLLNETK